MIFQSRVYFWNDRVDQRLGLVTSFQAIGCGAPIQSQSTLYVPNEMKPSLKPDLVNFSHLSLTSLAFSWFRFLNIPRVNSRKDANSNSIFSQPSLHGLASQSRKHDWIIFFSEVVGTHGWVFCGIPMCTLQLHKVNPLLSSLFFSPGHLPYKKVSDEVLFFFLRWECCCTREQRNYQAYPVLEVYHWKAWNDFTNCARHRPILIIPCLVVFWKNAIFHDFEN